MRLSLITSFALCPLIASYAAEVWAPGVSRDGGWVDFNKDGGNGEDYMQDSLMCWAASVSNVVTWWQNRNAGSIPAGTLPTASAWDVFRTVYKDDGGYPSSGYDWWINGLQSDDYGNISYPSAMDLDAESKENTSWFLGGFLKDAYDSSKTENKTYLSSGNTDSYAYSKLVVDAIANGYALSISAFPDSGVGGHAYTLWGVEYEETDSGIKLTKAFVTDSDDGSTEEKLVEKELIFSDKAEKPAIVFADSQNYFWTNLAGMRTVIPEPSAFGVLAGIFALFSLCLRRSRN